MRRATLIRFFTSVFRAFQSTLSMRRATCANSSMRVCMSFQSTLSMRRATTETVQREFHQQIFQSTLSMRRATSRVCADSDIGRISIHALHEESDGGWNGVSKMCDISIHALHEESDYLTASVAKDIIKFQSTLSMRRATSFRLLNFSRTK